MLLSLHAVRATYDSSRPFMPWLLAIVRNRLVDGARRYGEASDEVHIEDPDVTFSEPATNLDQEGSAMSRPCTGRWGRCLKGSARR